MSMRKPMCAAAVLGACIVSAPAAAQDTIASRLNQPAPAQIRGRSALEGMKTAFQFGECTVKRTKGRVVEALDIPVDDPLYDKKLRALATRDCLAEGEVAIPMSLMRGILFEALYRERFGRARLPLSAAKLDYTRGYKQPLSERAKDVLALVAIGACAVRASPDAAHQMIVNEPGSPAEKSAASTVAAQLPACVVQGQTVRFSRAIIRAAIAEGLYRLATQAADQGLAAR